ncbi:MAG: hypothetical protein AAGU32_22030 [Bacillota bacterium]
MKNGTDTSKTNEIKNREGSTLPPFIIFRPLSHFITSYLQRIFYNPEAKNATVKELLTDFAYGAALSGIMQGTQMVGDIVGGKRAGAAEQQAKRDALTNAYMEARARNRQIADAVDTLQATQQAIDKPASDLYYGYIESSSTVFSSVGAGETFDTDNALALSTRFVNKMDPIWKNSENIKPINGYQDIVCHVDKTGFSYLNLNGNEINMTPREFAEILKNSPVYEGQPIRLISCEAGADGSLQRSIWQINSEYLCWLQRILYMFILMA